MPHLFSGLIAFGVAATVLFAERRQSFISNTPPFPQLLQIIFRLKTRDWPFNVPLRVLRTYCRFMAAQNYRFPRFRRRGIIFFALRQRVSSFRP